MKSEKSVTLPNWQIQDRILPLVDVTEKGRGYRLVWSETLSVIFVGIYSFFPVVDFVFLDVILSFQVVRGWK